MYTEITPMIDLDLMDRSGGLGIMFCWDIFWGVSIMVGPITLNIGLSVIEVPE